MELKHTLQTIKYNDGTQEFIGWITNNTSEKLPGVLILPAWFGADEEAKSAATKLEKLGFIALIADIYGNGYTPKDKSEASGLSSRYKQDYEVYQQRIATALQALLSSRAIPEKIAVIGYCFGGTGALEAARGNLPVAGVVSIHGGLYKDPNRKNYPISTKVLIEHPADDHTVRREDYDSLITELNTSEADWHVITYSHAKHTFTNPASPDYHALNADRAWKHTILFLNEVLK